MVAGALLLSDFMRGERTESGYRIEVSRHELALIQQAMNEVTNGPEAIEDWEFGTRMGGSRDEVKALMEAVRLLAEP